MNIKSITRTLLLLFLMSISMLAGGKRQPENVSLVQLLAAPKKYDKKIVAVSGFYHREFESCGLYLCKEDAEYSINKNAIWIGSTAKTSGAKRIEDVNDVYVEVVGVFCCVPTGGGHTSMGTGELNDITFLLKLPRNEIASRR